MRLDPSSPGYRAHARLLSGGLLGLGFAWYLKTGGNAEESHDKTNLSIISESAHKCSLLNLLLGFWGNPSKTKKKTFEDWQVAKKNIRRAFEWGGRWNRSIFRSDVTDVFDRQNRSHWHRRTALDAGLVHDAVQVVPRDAWPHRPPREVQHLPPKLVEGGGRSPCQ